MLLYNSQSLIFYTTCSVRMFWCSQFIMSLTELVCWEVLSIFKRCRGHRHLAMLPLSAAFGHVMHISEHFSLQCTASSCIEGGLRWTAHATAVIQQSVSCLTQWTAISIFCSTHALASIITAQQVTWTCCYLIRCVSWRNRLSDCSICILIVWSWLQPDHTIAQMGCS